MDFIELDNTMGGLRKIKEALTKVVIIFGCLSMILFAGYYSYLMVKNVNEFLYLIIYSVLFVIVLASFIVDGMLTENKNSTRKKKREIIESKRKIKRIIKVPKYCAKAILVGIAIFETLNNFNLGLSNIINIMLAIILVFQILLEVVTHYITYYMDYLMMCVKKDIEESKLVKIVGGFHVTKKIGDALEDWSYKRSGESKYTKQELEMREEIDKWKDKVEEEKELKVKEKFVKGVKDAYEAGKERVKKMMPKKKED